MEQRFFDNCKERGYPPGEAEEIWRQIQSFASFSFAKGHSASYAVESYQSLYLKAHHPLEFLVGVANNSAVSTTRSSTCTKPKRAGATIEAPCVNTSEELCCLVRAAGPQAASGKSDLPLGKSPLAARIYLGLGNVKSLESGTVQLILNNRAKHGPFTDLQDLLKRVPLGVEQARILVRVGRCASPSEANRNCYGTSRSFTARPV